MMEKGNFKDMLGFCQVKYAQRRTKVADGVSEKMVEMITKSEKEGGLGLDMEKDADSAQKYLHSTASQAAETARLAGAKRLLLGHFSSRYDDENMILAEATPIFPNTSLANEGMVIPV